MYRDNLEERERQSGWGLATATTGWCSACLLLASA